MEDNPPIFRQGFSYPALLFSRLIPHVCFRIQGYHLLWPGFPSRFANQRAITARLFQFRSPLLSESQLISFPRATEIFQFTRFTIVALSVDDKYLALEDNPPIFRQGFSYPALLFANLVPHVSFHIRGFHPLWPAFPDCSDLS